MSADPTPVARPVARYSDAEHLASGGLGDVFSAHDAEVPRRVALKQIRANRALDPVARAEFEREARLAGSLEHPGIVPVYSLSRSDDGHPFYAMRLIGGRTLRAAVAAFHENGGDLRSLEFRQLLTRTVAVCQAVEFAHSRGVIHRDLKPDNVMLGEFGETLVIDWGLAKRVGDADSAGAPRDEGAGVTQDGSIKGTFAYMAPEQAAGAVSALGPACDVFALGGILFTLLTGELPTGGASRLDILANLDAGEIRGPRAARRDVPAALDAVCRRAMAHLPDNRYRSAGGLAADLERYLADEPVSAYRAPLLARAGRWARKHPAAVSGVGATLAVAFVALAVGLAVVGGKNAELRASEARATGRFELARNSVEQFLGSVTQEPELQNRGLHGLRKRLLESAMPFFTRLSEETGDRPSSRRDRARALFRLAELRADLGENAASLGDYESAASIQESLVGDFPGDALILDELAVTRGRLGILRATAGDGAGADREWGAAADAFARLAAARPDDIRPRVEAAGIRINRALIRSNSGDRAGAISEYGEVLAALLPLTERPHPDPAHLATLGIVRNNLGSLAASGNETARAEREYRESLAVRLRLVAARPGVPGYRSDLAVTRNALGLLARIRGDSAGATAEFRLAAELLEALVAEQPAAALYRLQLGVVLSQLAEIKAGVRQFVDSVAEHDRAIEILRPVVRAAPDDLIARSYLRNALAARAGTLAFAGRHDPAAAEWERAAELSPEPERPVYRRERARALAAAGRRDEAIAVMDSLLAADPAPAETAHDAAVVYLRAGDPERAARALARPRAPSAYVEPVPLPTPREH